MHINIGPQINNTCSLDRLCEISIEYCKVSSAGIGIDHKVKTEQGPGAMASKAFLVEVKVLSYPVLNRVQFFIRYIKHSFFAQWYMVDGNVLITAEHFTGNQWE